MDKVLAIQNCGISGSVFLQSLLDGHPQICALPALYGQTLLCYWDTVKSLSKHEILTKFIADHPWYFEKTEFSVNFGLADMGPDKNEVACVDRERFTTYLYEECASETVTRKDFIVGIFRAYNRALGRPIDDNAWILYPIHCQPQQFAKQLADDFELVRFIHTVREPIQNVGSIANHVSKNRDWNRFSLLSCAIGQIFCDHTVHAGNHPAHGLKPYLPDALDQSVLTRAVRLEDIHKNAPETLAKICNFINIPWNDCLLQSTFDGKLWHNRPETIRQTGFGTKTITQKHEHLMNPFDRWRFGYLSQPFQAYYGYQHNKKASLLSRFYMPILMLAPFRMESIKKNDIKLKARQYITCRLKWMPKALKRARQFNQFIPLL